MCEATVVIRLEVPSDFTGCKPFGVKASLDDFVSHWLEEGYFVNDHVVELPSGIQYKGFDLSWEASNE